MYKNHSNPNSMALSSVHPLAWVADCSHPGGIKFRCLHAFLWTKLVSTSIKHFVSTYMIVCLNFEALQGLIEVLSAKHMSRLAHCSYIEVI